MKAPLDSHVEPPVEFGGVRCPKCGGEVTRALSLFEAIGLLVPINLRTWSRFSCEARCYEFRGPRGWGSFILSLIFGAGLLMISGWTAKAAAAGFVLLPWSILAWTKSSVASSPIVAGCLCGSLWAFVSVFNGWVQITSGVVFSLYVLGGLGAGYAVGKVDALTVTPGRLILLKRTDTVAAEESQSAES